MVFKNKKLKVKKPKAVKVTRGTICPHCEEIFSYPAIYSKDAWSEVPHKNILDCVKFLRKSLTQAVNHLKENINLAYRNR